MIIQKSKHFAGKSACSVSTTALAWLLWAATYEDDV